MKRRLLTAFESELSVSAYHTLTRAIFLQPKRSLLAISD